MILNPWDRQGNQIADGRGVYPNLRGCGGAGYQQGYVLSFDKHHEPIVLCTSECRCYDAYQHHGWRESETIGTMTELQNVFVRGDTPLVVVFDARGNGGGETAPTITGDHQDRITDYTAIVVEGNAEDIHREEIL